MLRASSCGLSAISFRIARDSHSQFDRRQKSDYPTLSTALRHSGQAPVRENATSRVPRTSRYPASPGCRHPPWGCQALRAADQGDLTNVVTSLWATVWPQDPPDSFLSPPLHCRLPLDDCQQVGKSLCRHGLCRCCLLLPVAAAVAVHTRPWLGAGPRSGRTPPPAQATFGNTFPPGCGDGGARGRRSCRQWRGR